MENITVTILMAFGAGAAIASLVVYLIGKTKTDGVKGVLAMTRESLIDYKNKVESLQAENRELAASVESRGREIEMLNERQQADKEERARQFAEQLKLVEEQVKTSTQQMLNQRSKELTDVNRTQMDAIINPLKETIAGMKATMESNKEVNIKNAASMQTAIEAMMKRAAEIGQGADHLADALRNNNKQQGNWGEVILDELLASQGLKEGVHYDRQTAMRDEKGNLIKSDDEKGRRLIPDVIVHYPDGKDAIIDSKVSLTAFLEYQEAKTEEEKAAALKRHIDSVEGQVKLLSKKDYSRYIQPSRQAIDYVIMFIPNESAYQLAMAGSPTLWRNAFGQGVFITGEMTLIAALRMISVTWTQVEQARNQEEIIRQAQVVVERTAHFMEIFDGVGDRISKAASQYEDAKRKLYSGNQSLLTASQRLVGMGVPEKNKRKLPKADTALLDNRKED